MSSEKSNNRRQLFLKIKESRITPRVLPVVWLLLLVIIFSVGCAIKGRTFLTTGSLKIMVDQALIVATVATGATFIFGTGNVNIALGSSTGLIAAVAAITYQKTESIALMFAVSFVIGIAVAFLSVLASTKFKVKILYVTVVMMTLLQALQQTILNNATVILPSSLKTSLENAKFRYIAFAVFFVICIVIFNFTKVGRGIKFYGTNPDCASATGFNNNWYLLVAFLVSGVGVALGALMLIARTGSVDTTTASTYNMDCMLAIVLGGMSVFGGSKSFVYSAVFGALTVTVLNIGLQMLGVDSMIIQGVRGIFFLVLVVVSQKRTELLPAKD